MDYRSTAKYIINHGQSAIYAPPLEYDPFYDRCLTVEEEIFRRKMGWKMIEHDDWFSIKCAYQQYKKENNHAV